MAVASLREGLRTRAEFEGSQVHVIPEVGRIVLRGSALNAAQKQAIANWANQMGGGVEIENDIRVDTR
jgi:osmotically-inducible protein OsmY